MKKPNDRKKAMLEYSALTAEHKKAMAEYQLEKQDHLNSAQPAQPTMLKSAQELLKFVSQAESHTAKIRSVLFGASVGGLGPKPETLEDIVASACERVASLCGELGTISNRLGGS